MFKIKNLQTIEYILNYKNRKFSVIKLNNFIKLCTIFLISKICVKLFYNLSLILSKKYLNLNNSVVLKKSLFTVLFIKIE